MSSEMRRALEDDDANRITGEYSNYWVDHHCIVSHQRHLHHPALELDRIVIRNAKTSLGKEEPIY